MSIVPRKDTLVEVPGLLTSVVKLHELGHRMRGDETGFKIQDVDNVDKVIDAIHDAFEECQKLHEKLETETIHASVLRHRLQFLPGIVKTQIQSAVTSAKQSNNAEVHRLQTMMVATKVHIDSMQDTHKALEEENASLQPEKERVRQQYEEIIATLNERMSEKAGKQIVLNETRDKLRETNQLILDLDDGIMNLKEDLIQERAENRMERKRVKKAVYDTTIKTRSQREENAIKKQELDVLQTELEESNDKLQATRENITKYETSYGTLDADAETLRGKLEIKMLEIMRLKQEEALITVQLRDEKAAFLVIRDSLEGSVQHLDLESNSEKSEIIGHKEKQVAIGKLLVEKATEHRADLARIHKAKDALQVRKAKLSTSAEDLGRVTIANVDLEKRIAELKVVHESIMANLMNQMADTRCVLAKERQERVRLRNERQQLQENHDVSKADGTDALQTFNHLIKEGQVEHGALSLEGSTLHKQLQKEDLMLAALKLKWTAANEEYTIIKTKKESEISTLQTHIEAMRVEKSEKESLIETESPIFTELERTFTLADMDYEEKKKGLVVLKNKKLVLSDEVQQVHKDMERAGKAREKNTDVMEHMRKKSMTQLKTSTVELLQIEECIFDNGCKLKVLIEENARFDDANGKLETEIANMGDQISVGEELIGRLYLETRANRDMLKGSWEGDMKMEDIFNKRDGQLVQDLATLLERTGKRRQVAAAIGDKLNRELISLDDFLEDVEKRRPAGSNVNITPIGSYMSPVSTPMPPGVRPPTGVSIRPHRSPSPRRNAMVLLGSSTSSASKSTSSRSTPSPATK